MSDGQSFMFLNGKIDSLSRHASYLCICTSVAVTILAVVCIVVGARLNKIEARVAAIEEVR